MVDQTRNQSALIIGAGIGGMQAALDIANAGHRVILVEKLPSIGGRMAQLSETFPTLDCSQCILTPRTVEVGSHPNIELLAYSEVVAAEKSEQGTYRVRIRRFASYVDWDICTGCGFCQEKCPQKRIPAEFQRNIGPRKAIYTLSPQAVPNKPVIDRENCTYFQKGKCRLCEKVCPVGAIDYEQQDRFIEREVGAIILATGYDLYPLENLAEYGGGKVPDVIDALAFERLLSASGPTAGKIQRPSDGKEPKEVVFLQCAGSREPERHLPHCSKVCCMYSAKQAILYHHRVHDGQPYIFYIDIRSPGKRYDEFIQRAMEDESVIYLRGKVSRVFRQNDHVVVMGADTLSGEQVRIDADLVVVALGLMPRPETRQLAEMLDVAVDSLGWLTEADGDLRPVETRQEGIFIAGAAVGPADIPETVAQASAAAAKVLQHFAGAI
ncbi:MAG: CoB--CoM heterodisulfide reductase iron-sulfur subunit A family protein [Anaerolineae bacterium]|nr:CoB--CoM heterodisulfide reductase iron-sulfur subunit A family protein [Anaerolineae bacterium]